VYKQTELQKTRAIKDSPHLQQMLYLVHSSEYKDKFKATL